MTLSNTNDYLNQQLMGSSTSDCLTLGCYPQAVYVPPRPITARELNVERVDNGYIVSGQFKDAAGWAHRREVALDADGLAKILKRWGAGHEKTA